ELKLKQAVHHGRQALVQVAFFFLQVELQDAAAVGEIGFVNRMVAESAEFAEQCLWFTCLVSKQSNIAAVKKAIGKFGAIDVKVVDMGQGNKRSRFVAWSFFSKQERSEWFI
ncbi:MAG: RlmF-related methyltransferase, partial [Pontibacterium sp.]